MGLCQKQGARGSLLTPYMRPALRPTCTSPSHSGGGGTVTGQGQRAEGCQLQQAPAASQPKGARPLGEGVASTGSLGAPAPAPPTHLEQAGEVLPGSPVQDSGVLRDNHRKRSSGRRWTGGLLGQTPGVLSGGGVAETPTVFYQDSGGRGEEEVD